MMKKILCGLFVLFITTGLISQETSYVTTNATNYAASTVTNHVEHTAISSVAPTATNDIASATVTGDFRAVWVCSVANLDFPSKKGLDNNSLKREIDAIIERTVDMKLGAVILQVRPSGDALYKSALFPWSEYLSGVQGVGPAGGFDPLAYWVEQAHRNDIELHAWLNPYRIHSQTTEVGALAANNPARVNPARAIAYKGGLYYDPALPENKKLIVDGVAEIVSNYNVDGIHLDDYFYPGTDFPDNASYARLGAGKNKADWRRENVNDLIKEIQKTVAKIKPSVRFGISPFAIWQNASSSPLGSETRGNEAYSNMYADTRRWVKEGWVDYICPQIYWHSGFEIADYTKILSWWANVCRETDVDLYIGHAAYREADLANNAGWTTGEIVRQLKLNASAYPDVVKGSVFFRFSSIKGTLGQQIKDYYTYDNQTNDHELPIITTLSVANPASNVSVTARGYFIFGASDPTKALYMNGEPVQNRSREGFFSEYVQLEKGANTFKFSQESLPDIVRTITLNDAPGTPSPTMAEAGIVSAFPVTEEYVSTGNIVNFRCTAPISASIKVRFNGETFELTNDYPNRQVTDNNKIYTTTYSYRYKIPEMLDSSGITELGQPTYIMTYEAKSYTVLGAPIKLIHKNAPFYATVTAESAWGYLTANTHNGSDLILIKGQKDAVTAISGDWVRLASGVWLEKKNVSYGLQDTKMNNMMTNGIYVSGNNDRLTWNAEQFPAAKITFDGTRLTIYFGLQTEIPPLDLSQSELFDRTVFKAMSSGVENGAPYYSFTVKDAVRLEGYYVSYTDKFFSLHIKKTRRLLPGDKPLSGFTFVIDAGHGADDIGAIGALGKEVAEKHINLINARNLAKRLSGLGATVVETRINDTFLTLHERMEISRKINPDMFLSMHANSVAESTNATNIRGITYWYRNPGSKPLADHLISETFHINPLTTRYRSSNQANFYVCRPAWTPSVIVEASFMCNIEDFSWLINPARQNEMADGITKAIVSYYRNNIQ